MADQRSRGGKKQSTGRQANSQGQQGLQTIKGRPSVGQPGGPKQPSRRGRDER